MAHNIDDMVAENEREDSFRGVGSAAWRKQEQQPSDWDGALRSQQIDTMRRQEEARNAALAEQMNANRGVFDGYMQIGNHMAAQKRQQVNNANAHLASALRLSAMNGGNLPQYSWGGISAALGIDPQRGAIIGGGFDSKSGKFRLQLASADRLSLIKQFQNAGQPIPDELRQPQVLEFTPQQQYSLMLSSPGVFSRQEVERMRNELINTYHMHPDQVPPVPLGWGETGRVGIGNATATGGTSVNPAWLYGPQRRANISAFGSNGRGGFTNYDGNDNTGHQLQVRDSGTRAEGDKGRWKVLSSGSHGDGRRGTRYENDKTGDVVFVPEGQTLESVTRGVSDKERVAQIQENAKNERAAAQNETRLSIADLTAQLKQQGYDVDEKKLAEAVRHHQAVESQQAENEKGRGDRAKQANELKTKMAETKSRGAIGGRPPTTHEYVEALRFANDLLNDEADRNAMREHAKRIEESLKQRGEKIPEPPSPSVKTEVKQGDNGNGGRTITRGQLDRAVKAGATYDEKTGILKTKDGRTMKIAGIQD